MKSTGCTVLSTILAAALGLALGLIGAPGNSYACHRLMDHGSQTCDNVGAGGGGGGGATKRIPIRADITAGNTFEFDNIGSVYVNQDGGVNADVGPGVFIRISGNGKDTRKIAVKVNCENQFEIGGNQFEIGDCTQLPEGAFKVPAESGLRDQVHLAARAYGGNTCPEFDVSGECLDAFTIKDGDSAQMGFTVWFDGGTPRLDIASAIGGGTAKHPGRCLSNMTPGERDTFLGAFCGVPGEDSEGDPEDCNVTVTADDDPNDSDKLNDSWTIKAVNETGLLCGFVDNRDGRVFVVYGVATDVSFEIQADVK